MNFLWKLYFEEWLSKFSKHGQDNHKVSPAFIPLIHVNYIQITAIIIESESNRLSCACDGERRIIAYIIHVRSYTQQVRLAYKAYPIERRITRISPTRESVHFLHPLTRVSHLLMYISLTCYKAYPIERRITRVSPTRESVHFLHPLTRGESSVNVYFSYMLQSVSYRKRLNSGYAAHPLQ